MLTYLIHYISKIFVLTELLQCDVSKFPNFSFSGQCFWFREISVFILSFNFQKNICVSKISHISLNFVTFQISYFRKISFLPALKTVFIFSKIFRIFETFHIYKFAKMVSFIKSFSNSNYAILITAKHFWKFWKMSKGYILEYFCPHF
jgi:hypothetical protein